MKMKLFVCLLCTGMISVPLFFNSYKEADAAYCYDVQSDAKVMCFDQYSLSISLKVPQVLDNMQSKGYRTYQKQTIKGTMYIVWLSDGSYRIEFDDLENKKFKVNGAYVTYEGMVDETIFPRFNFIGSNKTGKFTTPCICFAVTLEPSYAIGEASEDNSFTLILSGKGSSTKCNGTTIAKKLSGYASGVQGCGCSDYGHKSPTRKATMNGPGNAADDVVATFGTWTAKWKTRGICSK